MLRGHWATCLLLTLIMVVPVTDVLADELVLELRPEPGVVVRVMQEPDWRIRLHQPFGDTIVMPRPGKRKIGMPPPELRQIDIDLDGSPDLAIHFPEAKPDDPLQIIRYLPAERRYETLHMPSSPATLCDWRNAVPDPELGALTLSCQRGWSQVTETVRFNAFGMPWLETRLIKEEWTASNSYPYIPMASQFSRWDEEGQELQVDALDGHGQPIYVTIPVPRTRVFEQPGREPADEYLSQGDRARLLDKMPRWLRLSWEGKGGMLDRWVWVPDAFNLAAQVDLASASDNSELLVSINEPGSDDLTGSLVNIFPITLTNKGTEPQTLDHPELHLIFYDQDAWHFWTQSLLNRPPITIEPGESVILEAGPLLVEYGGYTLVHPMPNDFDREITIFPGGLSAAKYSVRAALTAPGFDAPLYSEEQPFCHDPPGALINPCSLTEVLE